VHKEIRVSDHWIILITEDPRYMPEASRRLQALERFKQLAPVADDLKLHVRDSIGFFDCAANFQRIICPACRAEIPSEWWTERLNEDAVNPEVDEGFKLNAYLTPCCNTAHTLNELVYDAPQGFARFALEAMNPLTHSLGPRVWLNEGNVAELAALLGVRLRVIYRRV
jgi:hypothetical protein